MEDLINATIYHPLVVTVTKPLTHLMCNVDFSLAGAFTLACTLSLQLFRVLRGNAYKWRMSGRRYSENTNGLP